MKIIATADLHGTLPEIPECDLLLIAGDVCPDFLNRAGGYDAYHRPIPVDKGEPQQASWLRSVFQPWLDEVPANEIVGIAGNHDFVFEHRSLVPRDPPLRWVYLQDNGAEVMGVRIHGIPWVPNLPFWAFNARDEVLALAYEEVPECDILLSHGPPLGHHDLAPSKYGSRAGEHVGSKAALNAIKRMKPAAFVCGHIHEGYGQSDLEVSARSGLSTRLYNVAYNDGGYNPVNPPIVIDL